ncbi:MAG: class I SAM-dependent methyltransferase [Phycisphaerae bacterium]
MSLSAADLERRFDAALLRRAALRDAGATDAIRLVHDAADGVPGVVVEQFGAVLVTQVKEGLCRTPLATLRAAVEMLAARVAAPTVYLKHFVRDRAAVAVEHEQAHRDAAPWIGPAGPAERSVHEHGLTFLVRPFDGFSVGLFLEQRDNRARVRAAAAGSRVLNLFAYTCGFSVAACSGGAAEVVSVDLSKRYLEWGRRNFAANRLPDGAAKFFCRDAVDHLRRAERHPPEFDLVILDPPTFARQRRPARVFVLREQLEPLLRAAIARVRSGGLLLACTNDRDLSTADLERAARVAAGSRRCTIVERPALPADFPGDAAYSTSIWVRIG